MSRAVMTLAVFVLLLCGNVDAQRYPPDLRINTLFGPSRDLFRSTVVAGHARKSPVLAGALSLLLPGIGSFYAGNPEHGARHLLITVGLVVGMGVACSIKDPCGDAPAGILIVSFANTVWSVVTAVGDANRSNRRDSALPRGS